MKIKNLIYIVLLVSAAGALGYSLGRLRPSLSSTHNNSAIKLYNQYKVFTIDTDCQIKGNASGKSKIYHLPGGQFYDRVKNPTDCFQTEQEATAAGFKRSSK